MAAVAHASPATIRRLSFVGAGPSPAAPPVRQPTTVYRRRRAVALLVVVTAVVALVLALSGRPVPPGGGPLTAPERVPVSAYVVQPGDTFWGIASRLAPGRDPRPLVAELVAAHGSPVLVPGERLSLPARL